MIALKPQYAKLLVFELVLILLVLYLGLMILEDFFERRLDIGFRDVVVFVKVLLNYIRT
jgi:hypothetical protein